MCFWSSGDVNDEAVIAAHFDESEAREERSQEKKMKTAVLSIAGDQDPLVSPEACKQLLERLQKTQQHRLGLDDEKLQRFHVVTGGGHGMPPNRELVAFRTFLCDVLLGASAPPAASMAASAVA